MQPLLNIIMGNKSRSKRQGKAQTRKTHKSAFFKPRARAMQSPQTSQSKVFAFVFLSASFIIAAASAFLLHASGVSTLASLSAFAFGLLCGIMAFDVLNRKRWEQVMTTHLNRVVSHHDRLVREVARNRNDISILKDGLGEMAASVETQRRREKYDNLAKQRAPSSDNAPNGGIIHSVLSHLAALGNKPRASIGTTHDKEILELELTPPPLSPLPRSFRDEAFEANDGTGLSDAVVSEIVLHSVRENKLNLFFQPVMRLPQRKASMVEVTCRMRAGAGVYIPAMRYMKFAKDQDLHVDLDHLVLQKTLQTILQNSKKLGEALPDYCINVSAASLSDSAFIGELLAFIGAHQRLAKHLIFELPQAHLSELDKKARTIMLSLDKIGCRFGTDTVRNRRIDVALFKDLKIRFFKINGSWLMKEAKIAGGAARIATLKAQLDHAGIDMIVEKIENEATLRELLDFNINYGQGYLFAKPDQKMPSQFNTPNTLLNKKAA
jgi:cyclic-di-GMP phosphodiesterase TipF (flagellum assembly factor)